jgi:uncharacterized protein (DUF1499 family)
MGNTVTGAPANEQKSKAATIGLWLGLLAGLFLIVAGPGYRLHFWGLTVGLLLVPVALLAGVFAVIFSLTGIIITSRNRLGGRGSAVIGLAVGVVALVLPALNIAAAVRNPLHDITTDTANPPQFSAVLPLRGSGPQINSAVYDDKIARVQHNVYPDIAPLDLDIPPVQAFDLALATVHTMGWELVASDPVQQHIEATATTFWFGFKDDVSIRITPSGRGSRVDVRSLSRIGQSDVGANAKRIRAYLSKLKAG